MCVQLSTAAIFLKSQSAAVTLRNIISTCLIRVWVLCSSLPQNSLEKTSKNTGLTLVTSRSAGWLGTIIFQIQTTNELLTSLKTATYCNPEWWAEISSGFCITFPAEATRPTSRWGAHSSLCMASLFISRKPTNHLDIEVVDFLHNVDDAILTFIVAGSWCSDGGAAIVERRCYHYIPRREIYHFRSERGTPTSWCSSTAAHKNFSFGFVEVARSRNSWEMFRATRWVVHYQMCFLLTHFLKNLIVHNTKAKPWLNRSDLGGKISTTWKVSWN